MTSLDRLKSHPGANRLVGIRHNAHLENDDWFSRSDVRRGLSVLDPHNFSYDILVHYEQLPSAIRVAQSLPNQRFILDHFGKPPIAFGRLEPWRTYVKQLSRCENVAVKLSGLVTEADVQHWNYSDFEPYFDVILNEFGPARMLFGSDWPVCLIATDYSHVLALARHLVSPLTLSERRSIFGEAALHWYELQ